MTDTFASQERFPMKLPPNHERWGFTLLDLNGTRSVLTYSGEPAVYLYILG